MIEFDLPIKYINLNTKQMNLLHIYNIRTVKDFVFHDYYDFRNISGIGKSTLIGLEKKKLELISGLNQNNYFDDETVELLETHEWYSIRNMFSEKIISVFKHMKINSLIDFLSIDKDEFFNHKSVSYTAWNKIGQVKKLYNNLIPGDIQANDEWSLLTSNFDLKTKKVLKLLNIQGTNDFIQIVKDDVLKFDGVGLGTWEKINEIKISLLKNNKELIEHDNYLLYLNSDVAPPRNPSDRFLKTKISDIIGDDDFLAVFNDNNITTVEEALKLDFDIFFNNYKISRKHTRIFLESLSSYCNFIEDNSPNKLISENLNSLFQNISNHIMLDSRNTMILCERMKGYTLEDLGLTFNCTRERIRQIVKKAELKVKSNVMAYVPIRILNSEIYKIIEQFAGIIEFRELVLELNKSFSTDYFDNLDSLDTYINVFYDLHDYSINDFAIWVSHDCQNCDSLLNELQRVIKLSQDGMISYDELREISDFCIQIKEINSCNENSIKLSRKSAQRIVKDCNLKFDDDFIYMYEVWNLKNSGLGKKIEAILSFLKESASMEFIYNKVSEITNEDLPLVSIRRAVLGAPNIYTWGRSEYIHIDNVKVDDNIIETIKNILSSKLKSIPFTALYNIYNDFRITFQKANIPNDYALATVIDIYLKEFYIDRYKYVYKEIPDSSTSIDSFIEDKLLESDDEVLRNSIKDIIVNDIGARPSVFEASMSRTSNIIHIRDGYIAHIDNIELSQVNLDEICSNIGKSLEETSQIGINKIFSNFQVKCIDLGIENSRMLYDLLRYYFSDRYDFTRFPHISTFENSNKGFIRDLVLEFFLENNRIMTIDEVDDHFTELGYSSIQIRMLIPSNTKLIKVYTGCYIHQDLIEWDDNKTSKLRELLVYKYKENLELGLFFGNIEQIIYNNEDQLPPLGFELSWTLDILRSLIRKIDDIAFIGNTKICYTVVSISDNIKNKNELIVEVLNKHFDGACSRDQLNNWFVENRIYIKQIPSKILINNKNLVVNDYECHVKRS